jgi:hypothetical protein
MSRASKPRIIAAVFAISLSASCGTTGGERIELQLAVRGTDRTSLEVNGATFTLSRAQVAVGPVYFCASDGADTELCETSLTELTQAVVIDGLAPTGLTSIALQGTTGEVRSALYDYGVSWFLTQQVPEALPGVEHSVLLEGTVARDGRELRFVTAVDVLPMSPGATAVHGQRTRHELADGDTLTLAVDPYLWLQPVDVDALFALDAQGTGQVAIERGTQAHEAILQGLQNRAPVQFEWQ